MTYDEAIDTALRSLQLGLTEHAHEMYDDMFLSYANECVLELSKDVRPVAHDEIVSVADGWFSVSALAHPIYNLLRVRAGDRIYHTKVEGDRVYLCNTYTGNVQVTYEYFPESAQLKTDSIQLPEQYHRLVPIYIAAQFEMAGDRWQQQRGRSKLQTFQELRRDLKKVQHGATDSYKLKNRGW
jgi:hypothetical protein